MARRLAAAAGTLVLVLAGAGSAAAALAPGLFGGKPPAGVVARDNMLTVPRGTPRGFVILIHGGGWVLTGRGALQQEAPTVSWLVQLGWGVYNVDYRAGWLSVVDVVAAYDHLRRLYPAAPMCALGQSAGGQLAMLLAASRPSLRCVISEAGVTDLSIIPASEPLHTLLAHVFHGELWEFSPVRLASHIHGTLLCAGSSFDRVVPEPEQLGAIRRARPATITMLLAGAPTPGGPSFSHPPNFVHASITPAARRRLERAIRRALADSTLQSPG
jgi:acetyl esterase/lipase